jgi:hypothetical protein
LSRTVVEDECVAVHEDRQGKRAVGHAKEGPRGFDPRHIAEQRAR